MRKLSVLAAIAIAVPLSAPADYSDEELSADIITGLVPLSTYWIAHSKEDGRGQDQYLRSVGASLALNSLLRLGFNQTSLGERPNGNRYAFPSGHTAFMASSAAFLQDRYGWQYGVPAYALTAYVAWVRVDTGHHHWRDVIAGTAVSWGVSRLFVTPYASPEITPIFGPKYVGLQWTREFGAGPDSERRRTGRNSIACLARFETDPAVPEGRPSFGCASAQTSPHVPRMITIPPADARGFRK